MIAISCENLTLSFGEKTILQNVSFAVSEGERLGVVGVNGAGKTSLFKILTGEYEADGNVYISKEKSIGILKQVHETGGGGTVYEEMLSAFSSLIALEEEIARLHREIEAAEREGMTPSDALIADFTRKSEQFHREGGYEYKNRAASFLSRLGFGEASFSLPVTSLSGGQRTRLTLGKLLLSRPDILLLDEPTNHLDIETMYWLEDVLADYPCTLIVISHDRYFLDRVCGKILEIENTKAKLYNGNYSAYLTQKEKDRIDAQKRYDNQQKEIARLEAFIEQQHRFNRERNIIAAESRQKAIDRMEKFERPEDLPEGIRFRFRCGVESGNEVLSVKGLSKSFPGHPLFSDIAFLVRRGERVFIAGENGCGKSTLLKILNGTATKDGGFFSFGAGVHIGYYDQENQNLSPEKTVLSELWDAYPRLTQTEVRSALAQFRFCGDDVFRTVSVLSGGEKARLTLCKLILSEHNVLILDEPTNHLDIDSREMLEDALSEYEGTVIAVSHDRYFIKKLSTRIIDIAKKPLLDHIGSYDAYEAAFRGASAKAETEAPRKEAASESKDHYVKTKKEASERRRRGHRITVLEGEIERTEAAIEETDRAIEENAADYVKLSALCEEKAEKEAQLLALYEELESLLAAAEQDGQ